MALLMRHAKTGVELDISLAFTRFELEALAHRRNVPFGRVEIPMARPEDLVIFKSLAARPKDIGDVTTLLLMHPDIDLARVRARVEELALLAEAPELMDVLESTIASAATVRRTQRSARLGAKQPVASAKKRKRTIAETKPRRPRR